MSKIENGGPAFPVNEQRFLNGDGDIYASEGMTLRDYFAAKVIGGLIADPNCTLGEQGTNNCARIAYEVADAMLRARSAR